MTERCGGRYQGAFRCGLFAGHDGPCGSLFAGHAPTLTRTKVCVECGADEVQTWRKGKCIATSIDPTTGLCIDCLPKRAAAAPIGPLFDRNAFDHDVPRGTTRMSSITPLTRDEPEQEQP